MNTLYDLFKVSEDATQEEIKKSYSQILEEVNQLPQNDQTINQIRRMKIAYGILSNPQKRKDYDMNLAEKRANELIRKIEIKKEEIEPEEKTIQNIDIQKQSSKVYKQKRSTNANLYTNNNSVENEKKLDIKIEKASQNSIKEEQDKLKKELQKEENKRLKEQKKKYIKEKRLEKKENQLKREMEIQAYGKYLENQGYKVKYPWTWSRIKRLFISIFVIVICLIIVWHIPSVNRNLKNLYNDNIIIQKIVDIFCDMFKAIFDGIKGIFIKS